jgi:hypothetical protein
MDIDWSEYKRNQSYRIKVDNYLAAKKVELALPRREWQPQRVGSTMIAMCDKRGLNVRGMTASEAAAVLKKHTRPAPARPYDPMTATPAEVDAYLTSLFGPA